MGVPTIDPNEFWARVDRGPDSECWPWRHGRHAAGYGVLYVDREQVLAHRMALVLTVGQPTEDQPHALHSCDNPPCCNPSHLRWGTHAENMGDARERGRAKGGRADAESCVNGHPFNEENTLISTRHDRKTGRDYTVRKCRECNRQYLARRRANRKDRN